MSPFFIRKQNESRGLFAFKIAGVVLLGIIGIGALAVLFGFIVMWLWNWLLPGLFGFSTITFWQGVAIVILARIIFGSFNHKPGSHHHSYYQRYKNRSKRKWFEKWELYDDFWKEEGEMAFNAYIEKHKTGQDTRQNQ
jgi:ABC-type multidrug transport system fused ATPase/permease subunit